MPRTARRKDWITGLAVTAAGIAVTLFGGFRAVEGLLYDGATTLADGRQPSEDIVVVEIDDRSIERLGAWPWSRYTLGEINALIDRGGPRVTGYALPLDTPQNEYAQETLRSLYQENRAGLDAGARRLFRRAIRDMGTDRVLAASFSATGNVVLGAHYRGAGERPTSLPALPGPMASSRVQTAGTNGIDPLRWFAPTERVFVERIRPPVAELARAAAGIGLGPRTDRSGARRLAPLALPHEDEWLASFPLLVHARANGIDPTGLRLEADGAITGTQGAFTVPTIDGGVLPTYHARTADGASPFRTVSAAAVHAREIDPAIFRDRIVLVGLTAPSLVEPIATAGGYRMPVQAFADELSSLQTGQLYRLPDGALWARIGAFALVGLYLMFLLPRLRMGTALATGGLLVVVLLTAELITLFVAAAWVPLVAPMGVLLLGHAVLGIQREVTGRIGEFQQRLTVANRSLADTHREAGRLDDAFRCLEQCSADRETAERWYALALDFERRRRFPQAADAFHACERSAPGFRDAAQRARRSDRLQHSVALGKQGATSAEQTLVLDDEELPKAMLGRFELERELGKGAMGTVYLGRDPRIGREVAIKTLPLDREFEGESLKDMKVRFMREAETAGRLTHPNIVTVHDVGEEQDLAWIAMDYLSGTPLVQLTDPDKLLPPGEVFEVMAQVADALAEAHGHNVVHRDIKPDNIIYDRESCKATVTDFGIACLLDHRNTRTGTILGSPSYMSPEQLAARDLDGRADLFSMGVTLYQLLTGQLPFVGDSLSNLMYRIANERHREVRRIRDDLPNCATTITNRCLEKDPERRYVSAVQLAQVLRRCRDRISAG